MDSETARPSPLNGCLVCHTEDRVELTQARRVFGLGREMLLLTCEKCGSVAQFDWDEESADEWRIRYWKVTSDPPYSFAAWRLKRAGWLDQDDALEVSTQIFVHRQRLHQTLRGELEWLKPRQLDPPPPLMSADETVYLALKGVNYSKDSSSKLWMLNRDDDVLDTGTFYVTDGKLHLLGQRRDRSERLSAIRRMEHDQYGWYIYTEDTHHYYGVHQEELLDGELIMAIIDALRRLMGE